MPVKRHGGCVCRINQVYESHYRFSSPATERGQNFQEFKEEGHQADTPPGSGHSLTGQVPNQPTDLYDVLVALTLLPVPGGHNAIPM